MRDFSFRFLRRRLTSRVALVIISCWLISVVILSNQLFSINDGESDRDKLTSALRRLKVYEGKLEDLRNLLTHRTRRNYKRDVEQEGDGVKADTGEHLKLLSQKQEVARRHLDRNVWEVFYLVHSILKKDKELKAVLGSYTENLLTSLLALSSNVSEIGGLDRYRKSELQRITDRIQESFERLQNPDDCSRARFLVCDLDKSCGLGCQLHHVAYCFMTAIGSQRTMILMKDGSKWQYSGDGWKSVFKIVTKCTYAEAVGNMRFPNSTEYNESSTERVVFLDIIDHLRKAPSYLPLSIPRKMKTPLLTLHSNPPVFFIGQFIWYLMRGNEVFNGIIQKAAERIHFEEGPIVGIQVRRTDKLIAEAQFHSVDEYMEWTEIWFQIEEKKQGKPLKRRVYIASDDPKVVPEAKMNYANYEVYGDVAIAESAQRKSRYSDNSLRGLLIDIRLLSMCDYLVCTLSSQVCRLAYELMQVSRGDAGEKFHSLDDLYYYGGQFPHEQVAIESYKATKDDEIDLRVGDVIGIAGNHWNGYSMGQNRRTRKRGLYPSYKAIEKWRIVDFPDIF